MLKLKVVFICPLCFHEETCSLEVEHRENGEKLFHPTQMNCRGCQKTFDSIVEVQVKAKTYSSKRGWPSIQVES